VNNKFFYAYAKKKLKNVLTIFPIMKDNEELASDPKKIAKILNQQYESIFSPPNEERKISSPSLFLEEPQGTLHLLPSVTITTADIIKAINNIAPNSATGPHAATEKM